MFIDYQITSFKYIPYSEILFFLILILWLFYIDLNILKKSIKKDKLLISFSLIFGLFLLGSIWSEDTINTLVILKTVMYFALVPILLTVYDIKYIRVLLIFLLSMIVLTSFFTIVLYIYSFSNTFEIKLSLTSPFINHMYYGTILSLGLVYFIVNTKFNEKKVFLILKLLSIVLILTAISLICNRSSLIGLFVAISLYIWIDKNKLTKLKRFFLVVLSLFLLVLFISKINSNCGLKFLNAKKTIENEVDGKRVGTSLGCRLNYIEASFDLIEKNIFIGVGTGDSLDAMKKLYGQDGYKDLVTKPCLLGKHNQVFYYDNHNMYLTILMLFGPIGLLIYLYFMYSIFREGIRVKSWELRLSIVIISLASIPITLFYTNSNFVLFFSLYIGIIYINKKEKKY